MTLNSTIQTDIARIIVAAQHALDQKKYLEFADYFTNSGLLYRPTSDSPLEGKAAIVASYENNPATRLNRHILSNILVTHINEKHATAVSYVTLYSTDVDTNPRPVFGAPVERCLIGEFHDQFVVQGNTWKIAERRALFTLNATQGAD